MIRRSGYFARNSLDDRPQQTCATRQIAAESPGPSAGTQKLVQQVAVAGFDVDKLKADSRATPAAIT